MCSLLSSALVFSLAPIGRGRGRTNVPAVAFGAGFFLAPLGRGRGERMCSLLRSALVFSLAPWERAGVRGADGT